MTAMLGPSPQSQAQTGPHQGVPAQNGRDGSVGDGRRQLAQPRIGDPLGQQEVARKSVLRRRPSGLIRSEAVREQDPGVNQGGVGQAGKVRAKGPRPVPLQEQTQDTGRRSLAGEARAQSSFLDECPSTGRRRSFQPAKCRRRRAARDQELRAWVGRDRPDRLQARLHDLAISVLQVTSEAGTQQHEVQWRIDVNAQAPPVSKVADVDACLHGQPAREDVVGRKVRQAAQDLAGASNGQDVRRVAVVREGNPLVTSGDSQEAGSVGRAQERDRSGPQDDETAAPQATGDRTQSSAERNVIRRPGQDSHIRRASPGEPLAVAFGQGGPGSANGLRQRSGVCSWVRMQDDDVGVGHDS